MSISYKCDKCGKKLRLEDIYTVKVKRVGTASALLDYDFCADCSCEARAAIDALIWDKEAKA